MWLCSGGMPSSIVRLHWWARPIAAVVGFRWPSARLLQSQVESHTRLVMPNMRHFALGGCSVLRSALMCRVGGCTLEAALQRLYWICVQYGLSRAARCPQCQCLSAIAMAWCLVFPSTHPQPLPHPLPPSTPPCSSVRGGGILEDSQAAVFDFLIIRHTNFVDHSPEKPSKYSPHAWGQGSA